MSGYNKAKLRPKFIDQFAGNYWFYDALSAGQTVNQVTAGNFFDDVDDPTFRNGDILAVNATDGNGIFNIRLSGGIIFIETFASSATPSQKVEAEVGTTSDITLSGLQTIDGYTTLANDRVLVKNQTNKAFNGVYLANAGAWTRAIDSNVYSEFVYSNIYVENGTINANTGWVFTNPDGGTMGVTAINIAKFSGSGATSNIGDYKDSAINSNHSGWLLCNGLAVSRTTYASLFTIVDTAFGAGDGSTTFNLPDGRGRVGGYIGTGVGLTARTLGQSIGEENHALTLAENASHTHSYNAPNSTTGDANRNVFLGTTFTASNSPTGLTTGSSGSGTPHNVMQPTLFMGNLFIYAGA
jgi:microcystin-dependent protein